MDGILGSPLPVFLGLTVVVCGGCAVLTAQSMADNWAPASRLAMAILLLGAADRFLVYGLFDGPLLSLQGYIVDTAVLGAIGAVAFRITRARRMVRQYPWLYERAGMMGWRERRPPLS